MPPNNGRAASASSSPSVASASIRPAPPVDARRNRSRRPPSASSATAVENTSNSNNAAILTLIPISETECASLLQNKNSSPPPEKDRDRRRIVLKLSSKDTDDDSQPRSNANNPTMPSIHHARKFEDGSVAASVMLGRNEFTGILQTSVSRALCEVSFSRGSPESSKKKDNAKRSDDCSSAAPFVVSLTMRKAPAQHAVHIDGVVVGEPIGKRIPLEDGSIISLYGHTGFAYLVKLIRDNQNEREALPENPNVNVKSVSQKRRADSLPSPPNSPKKPTPHQEIRRRGHQLMVGEQTCSLCMDILIRSTFAYPCAHAFCAECTDKCRSTCPTCRGHVEGWMPARSLDTIIWATALQGCLDPDDAESYLARRKICGEEEPTEHERECILGKAAKEENGGENGYYVPPPSASCPTPLIAASFVPTFFAGGMHAGLSSFPVSWTGNGTNYAHDGKSGTSAEDAICLDSP